MLTTSFDKRPQKDKVLACTNMPISIIPIYYWLTTRVWYIPSCHCDDGGVYWTSVPTMMNPLCHETSGSVKVKPRRRQGNKNESHKKSVMCTIDVRHACVIAHECVCVCVKLYMGACTCGGASRHECVCMCVLFDCVCMTACVRACVRVTSYVCASVCASNSIPSLWNSLYFAYEALQR